MPKASAAFFERPKSRTKSFSSAWGRGLWTGKGSLSVEQSSDCEHFSDDSLSQLSCIVSNVFIVQWRQAFKNWNRNFFKVWNRPNSWGNVRICNLMSFFLPNTRCVYHAEITVSYMVVGLAPNHWNSKRQTFAFSFGPVSKHFITIVAHNMRSPLFVLITRMNFKKCLVGTLDEQGYVTSLTIECVGSTYVAEGIRLVSAMRSYSKSHV